MIIYVPIEVPDALLDTLLKGDVGSGATQPTPPAYYQPEASPAAAGDPWESYSPEQPAPVAPQGAGVDPAAIAAAVQAVLAGQGAAAPTVPSAPPTAGATFPYKTRNGTSTVTLGKVGAPACSCGVPAAYQAGSTNGKPWNRWVCGRIGPDTRPACKFSEFA